MIVHGLAEAGAALAVGAPVTLLSGSGAGLYAGCMWWRELVRAARAAHPTTQASDVLDCADASGMAMAALRSGVCRLVLWPEAPGWQSVVEIAQREGGWVLSEAPAALDMAKRNAHRQLQAWLHGASLPPP